LCEEFWHDDDESHTITKFMGSHAKQVSQLQPKSEMYIEAMEMLSQASYDAFALEWSMLCQDCTDCWTTTGKLKFNSKLNKL